MKNYILFLLLTSCLTFGEVNFSLNDQVEVQGLYEEEVQQQEAIPNVPNFENNLVQDPSQNALVLSESDGETEEELSWQEKTYFKFGVGPLLGSFTNPSEQSSTAVGFRLDMMSEYSALGVDFKTFSYKPENKNGIKLESRFYEIKPWLHYYRARMAPVSFFVPYLGLAPSFNMVKENENGISTSYNRFGLHAMLGLRTTINEFIRIYGEAEYAYIKEVNGFNASLGVLYLF